MSTTSQPTIRSNNNNNNDNIAMFRAALAFAAHKAPARVKSSNRWVLAKAPPTCHLRELDLCLLPATAFFQNPSGVPVGTKELAKHCAFLDESRTCFQSYAETCLTNQQQGLLGMLSSQPVELLSEICATGSERHDKYLRNAQCFRSIQHKHQKSCVTDLQVGLESIHKQPVRAQLATWCCNQNKFIKCIMDPLKRDCGQEASEFVEDSMKKALSSRISLACRNYEASGSACADILPKNGTKPKNSRNTSVVSRVIGSYASIKPSP